MGNNGIQSMRELLKALRGENTENEAALRGRTNIKNTLKGLFVVNRDNDYTSNEKEDYETQKKELESALKTLSGQMDVLQTKLDANKKDISELNEKITDCILQLGGETEKAEDDYKFFVIDAISQAETEYKHPSTQYKATQKRTDPVGFFASLIAEHIGDTNVSDFFSKVYELQGKLNGFQTDVNGLLGKVTGLMDQRTALKNQYSATSASHDLLSTTINQIGATETNYSNNDYGTEVPIYSLTKTNVVTDLFNNGKYYVASTNEAYDENTKRPTLESVTEKNKQFLGVEKGTTGDSYSLDNPALVALKGALDNNILQDLAIAGLNSNEIAQFLADNFSGANINIKDGVLNIPYGHKNAESAAVYTRVNDFFANGGAGSAYVVNTWDKNAGNTIQTNEQLKNLSNNYGDILEVLSGNNCCPAFTFKEAMYALFDSKNGLYKDCGIHYDLDKQTGQPKYYIEYAGDQETAKMYQDLADAIYNVWGVKPSYTADYSRVDGKDQEQPVEPEPIRTDPFTFTMNNDKNTEYAFIIDRNGDNGFTDAGEFVGGKEGKTWVDDLKSLDKNSDGKLEGDELKGLKILKSSYTDNANYKYLEGRKTSRDENGESKFDGAAAGFLRYNENNIQYGLTDLESLGIESINYSDGLNGNAGKNQVDKFGKDKTDINGSTLYDDNFTIAFEDGEKIKAIRKDDLETYMNTVYSDAYGKKFSVNVDEAAVDNSVNEALKEFEYKFDDNNKDLYGGIATLQQYGSMKQEADDKVEKAKNDSTEFENAERLKASAPKLGDVDGETENDINTRFDSAYPSIKAEINKLAAQEGINLGASEIYMKINIKNIAKYIWSYRFQDVQSGKIISDEEVARETVRVLVAEKEKANGGDVRSDEIKDGQIISWKKSGNSIAQQLIEENIYPNLNVIIQLLAKGKTEKEIIDYIKQHPETYMTRDDVLKDKANDIDNDPLTDEDRKYFKEKEQREADAVRKEEEKLAKQEELRGYLDKEQTFIQDKRMEPQLTYAEKIKVSGDVAEAAADKTLKSQLTNPVVNTSVQMATYDYDNVGNSDKNPPTTETQELSSTVDTQIINEDILIPRKIISDAEIVALLGDNQTTTGADDNNTPTNNDNNVGETSETTDEQSDNQGDNDSDNSETDKKDIEREDEDI